MKPSVLCISRKSLTNQNIPVDNADGIYPFNLDLIQADHFHFINRSVVDDSQPTNFLIGATLPQILGYCVIYCGEYVLTYSRKRGAETRLHGSRSIGFGGHVDIADYDEHSDTYVGYIGALLKSIERELHEELDLHSYIVDIKDLNSIIVDQTNPVGCVHVGLPLHIKVEFRNELEIDHNEIYDPQWIKIQDLKNSVEEYENWSKLIIKML